MTIETKKDLLTRSIWTFKEAKEYLNIKSDYCWHEFYRQVKNETSFTRRIYRDEIMRILGTTASKEIELLKGAENGK